MKRRLLKVVEHDPDTNKDELEYRKILMEFQKKSRDAENTDGVGDMLSKFGLDENYKIISPKYGVVYTKIKYGLFIIFGFILSLIYQSNMKYINPYLKKTGVYVGEEDVPVIIHFLSLSLTMFFGFHALMCSPLMGSSHKKKNDYQNKYFMLFKIPLFLACLVAPYFIIPEFVINIHVYISKYVMFFYLFLSTIFIIDFAYRWSRAWHDEDDWRWDTCLISVSCVFIILSLAIYAVSFYNSGFKNSGCLLNFYVTTFTCLLSLILLISSLFTEHASLFSGSMITFYIAVTSLNVLMSKPLPEKQCSFSNTYPVTLAAMIFSLFSILYSAIYSTTGLQFLAHFLWYGEEPEDDDEHDFVKDDKSLNNSYFFYHSFLTVCSFYLTNFFQQYQGWNELGVQVFLLLFTMALYGWSMLAPYVLYWRRFD